MLILNYLQLKHLFHKPEVEMGPKKVMKAMESGLGKPVMKSGLGKPAMKSALGKAKAKAKSSKGSWKNKLNKTNLEKLGNMTLDEKIKSAAETGGSVEEQALVLKESLWAACAKF